MAESIPMATTRRTLQVSPRQFQLLRQGTPRQHNAAQKPLSSLGTAAAGEVSPGFFVPTVPTQRKPCSV